METLSPVPLTQRLVEVAGLWAAGNGATLARLGRIVNNDTAFFTRLESAGASTTTATLEKFARYLADPANWPAGEDGLADVPAAALDFAHAVGVTVPGAAASAGNAGESSPDVGRAAA